MKKTSVKQKLSKLEDFQNPRIELEQYSTPPELAADIVYTCYMQGHKNVADLGTGTGILAIGASILGMNVTAVEIDAKALETARRNAEKAGADLDFVQKDVTTFEGVETDNGLGPSRNSDGFRRFDAVVMNPPFNIQSSEGLKFWRKAFEIGDNVYGLAGKGFGTRLKRLCEEHNHELIAREAYKIGLPASYEFHTEESRSTPVDLYITRRKK